MTVPILFAGVVIGTIAFVWLPKLGPSLSVGDAGQRGVA
jgi:DHA1 family bicyclomycin/chloramphenicol resistance-like MFS transporter